MTTTHPVDDLVATLHQDQHWVSRDGADLVTLSLDDMPAAHRDAVLGHLRDRAVELHLRHYDDVMHSVQRGASVHDVIPALARHMGLDPHVWLEETALVRRLVELHGWEPRPARLVRFLPKRLWGRG